MSLNVVPHISESLASMQGSPSRHREPTHQSPGTQSQVFLSSQQSSLDEGQVRSTDLGKAQQQWRQLLQGNHKDYIPPPTTRPTALSSTNMRNNQPWGDLLSPKNPLHTRLYSINANGITLDRRGGTFDSICRTLREIQADVYCIQEHNLDTTQYNVRSIMYETVNNHWERNRIVTGTTPITFETHYKPGGTLMTTVGSTTGRVVRQVRDKWGRWVIQEFLGRENRKVAIYSVYQPVDKSVIPGTITVASQQHSLLTASHDKVTNPRTAFRRDLRLSIQQYTSDKTLVMLVGDLNEQLGSDPEGMSKIADEFGLIDVMHAQHQQSAPATYARGSKRLDFVLASKEVAHAVQAAGYEAFNSRIPSDHRGYFVDFDSQLLFGSATQELASISRRGLSARNAGQVTEYIRQKYRLLLDQNVFERARRLLHPGNRHTLAEALDAATTQASLLAESKVHSVGEPAWSVALATARHKVSLLTKQLSSLRHGQRHSVQIESEWASVFTGDILPGEVPSCSAALRQAKSEVKEMVLHSYQRRDDERKRRIQQLELSHKRADRKTAERLRRLKKAEDIKQLFRKLKIVRTKQVKKGVTRIEIPLHPDTDPKNCTEWRVVEVPSEILSMLQNRNKAHFGQAQGTPFTVPPLSHDLGFRGDTDSGDQILNNEYDGSELTDNVKLLLQHLSLVHEMTIDSSRPTITDDEFCAKLRVWSESTTTSPSGLHLGHFKALIARHSFSTDLFDDELSEEFRAGRDELDFKQKELRELHLTLVNYALERGYSFTRWQTIANTILFKDPDNTRLDRTRVIHIYEADYNLALGLKWRMAMYQAEDLRLLNDGQFGSRPHRTAIDPVFGEELQCEISRATRKTVALMNYDAKACYDRIIPCIAMLVSRKYGVPKTVAQMNMATLEKAVYRIRTELGLSPTGYSHTSSAPIYGTGQGSANSPAIWCFLSCSLFDAYEKSATAAIYQSPLRDITASLGLLGFVDDCNGQSNLFESDVCDAAVDTVLEQTKENAQQWNDLLYASGGELELTKSSCQVLHWMFTSQGAPVVAPKDPRHQEKLQVKDRATNQEHKLEVLSPYQAHKTLGHFKDPAGIQAEQLKKLRQKSNDLTSFLWFIPLSRLESWTFYYACYLPSVTYPLACSYFKRQQLNQVESKAMSIIIPRCVFNRHTKREIIYGPLALGGASFRQLYVEQGIGQVQLFLRHWRATSVTGRLLKIAVQWFQYQVGVSFPFLTQVSRQLPHLESKWLASLRGFLDDMNSSLQVDQPGIPELQREHDCHIMDAVLEHGTFTDAEIKKINYCRLFLKAHTLSDLAEVTGVALDSSKLMGKPSLTSSLTAGNTINQARPSENEWRLWKRANLLWSTTDGTFHQPLGSWILPIHRQRQRHQGYATQFSLWVRIGECYFKCEPTTNYGWFRETSGTKTWQDLSPQAVPVHVSFEGHGMWKTTRTGCTMEIPPQIRPATFQSYLSQQDPWEVELLSHLDMADDPFTLSWKFSFGVRGVSDGSVWIKKLGAFGWVLATDAGEQLAECMGPAPGANPNSYRSEAYGLLSMLCFLKHIANFTGYHESWTGLLASDNQALVNTVNGKYKVQEELSAEAGPIAQARLPELSPEWDLVHNIRELMKSMTLLQLVHVKGHQDRHVEYRNLALLSRLNVDADRKANRYQEEFGAVRPHALLTSSAGAHLVTPQGTVTSHYATAIRRQFTFKPLWDHIQRRNKWSSTTMNAINWAAHSTCLRKRIQQKVHFVKLVHDLLPTNKNLHRAEPARQKCPCCEAPGEDWKHIIRCKHQSRQLWRQNTHESLRQVARKWSTEPRLLTLLLDGIMGWMEADDPIAFTVPSAIYDDEFETLIHAQNAIGWGQMFLGRFALHWSDLQDDYYAIQSTSDSKRKRTGQRWQTTMINHLWDRWILVWTLRNQVVHGADVVESARIERQKTLRTLRELYELRPHIEPSRQELLMADIRLHESKPTWQIKNWLTINEPIIRASFKHVKKKAIQGMRSIRQYFSGIMS